MSPRGLLYAQALADHMNALPCRDHMTVWTSERWRTKQTAAHIRAPKRVVRALNELDAVSTSYIKFSLYYSLLNGMNRWFIPF